MVVFLLLGSIPETTKFCHKIKWPEISLRPSTLLCSSLVCVVVKVETFLSHNVVEDLLRPTVDILPLRRSHTELVGGDVNHERLVGQRLRSNVFLLVLSHAETTAQLTVVVPLTIREDDDTVIAVLVCGLNCKTTTRCTGLSLRKFVTKGKATTRTNIVRTSVESVDLHTLANFTQQDGKSSSGLEAVHLRLLGDFRHPHRRRSIHDKGGFSLKLRECFKTLEHDSFQFRFELGSVLCRRNEAERKHTLNRHARDGGLNHITVYTSLHHVAKVTQYGEGSKLLLLHETSEGILLVLASREVDFPRVRSCKLLELPVRACDREVRELGGLRIESLVRQLGKETTR